MIILQQIWGLWTMLRLHSPSKLDSRCSAPGRWLLCRVTVIGVTLVVSTLPFLPGSICADVRVARVTHCSHPRTVSTVSLFPQFSSHPSLQQDSTPFPIAVRSRRRGIYNIQCCVQRLASDLRHSLIPPPTPKFIRPPPAALERSPEAFHNSDRLPDYQGS